MTGGNAIDDEVDPRFSGGAVVSLLEVLIQQQGAGEGDDVRLVHYDCVVGDAGCRNRQRVDASVAVDHYDVNPLEICEYREVLPKEGHDCFVGGYKAGPSDHLI